jgi:hypothetical protein
MKKILVFAFIVMTLTSYGQRNKKEGTLSMTINKDSTFLVYKDLSMIGAHGSHQIRCNKLTTTAYIKICHGIDTVPITFSTGYDTIQLKRGKIAIVFPDPGGYEETGMIILKLFKGSETTATFRDQYYFRKE